MIADSPELVYAVPRQLLIVGSGWRGVRSDDVEEILARIDRDGDFYPRPAAEADTTIKQIIPYLVLRDGERIFLMKRTKAGGDARLHDHFSVGVGGHMNPGDESVLAGLRREWREELVADFVPAFEFLGLLNDDEVEVGARCDDDRVLAAGLGKQRQVGTPAAEQFRRLPRAGEDDAVETRQL